MFIIDLPGDPPVAARPGPGAPELSDEPHYHYYQYHQLLSCS